MQQTSRSTSTQVIIFEECNFTFFFPFIYMVGLHHAFASFFTLLARRSFDKAEYVCRRCHRRWCNDKMEFTDSKLITHESKLCHETVDWIVTWEWTRPGMSSSAYRMRVVNHFEMSEGFFGDDIRNPCALQTREYSSSESNGTTHLRRADSFFGNGLNVCIVHRISFTIALLAMLVVHSL